MRERGLKSQLESRVIFAILSIVLLSLGIAEVPAQSCDFSDGNSYALAACAIEHEEAAQEKLDKAWNAIARFYAERPEDQAWLALQRSQRAWEAYMQAECNDYVAAFFSNGSIRPMMIIACRAQMKLRRYCRLNPPNPMKDSDDRETCAEVR